MKDIYQKQVWRENQNKILSILREKPLTFTELVNKSRLSRSAVNNHLKDLEKTGKIQRIYEKGKLLIKPVLSEEMISRMELYEARKFLETMVNPIKYKLPSEAEEHKASFNLFFDDPEHRAKKGNLDKLRNLEDTFGVIANMAIGFMEMIGVSKMAIVYTIEKKGGEKQE